MATNPHAEFETRRIILFRGKKPEVLVATVETHATLPEIQIPRWQRVAENLTAVLSETWGIDAVLLSSLEAPTAVSSSRENCYEIMEACGPDSEAPRETEWVAVDCLVENGFRDSCDFQAVRQAIAQVMARAEETSRGPFTRLGWFPDLKCWVQGEIGTHGLHLTGNFRQLNASPTFSLIRFETDGPAVWFKAVGQPNQREYSLTLALARSFSRFLPKIIAVKPEWNGWLAREVEGSLLHQRYEFVDWERAAADLAELQISSLGQSLHLLDPGARDLRAWALVNFVDPFFEAMGELMERQSKIPPATLSREELRRLSMRARDALAVLEETGVPNTLGHLDINPGNIVCASPNCVFLDWAEAFVGHPFLTFEYLLEHFRRSFPENLSAETHLIACYSSQWRAFISEIAIRRTLEASRLVAVFACAIGNDQWKDRRKLQESLSAGYLRSLTRRMEREARRVAQRSMPCLT